MVFVDGVGSASLALEAKLERLEEDVEVRFDAKVSSTICLNLDNVDRAVWYDV